MKKFSKKVLFILTIALAITTFIQAAGFAQATKIGYVDLRRAFYEYKQSQTLEKELNELTDASQNKRNTMIQEITKLRDEGELMSGPAREKKQAEIDGKLRELQEFDRQAREQILNKKNEMFRMVIEDIQKVVEEMGKSQGYNYIMDSRNIMYADESEDLTDQVIQKLNK